MTDPSILVAGIGNIFLGDDAFGVEVAQRLARQPWPDGVRVVDFGIRGFDLAYAILDGYDVTIMIDAIQRGGSPGTLYVIEADLNDTSGAGGGMETHNIHPMRVLDMVRAYGGDPHRVLVVGCEPATFGPEDEGQMGLSAPITAVLDEAITLVERLVQQIRTEAAGAGGTCTN